jgi:hypothetical protein
MAKMDRAALSGRMVSGGGMNGNMDKVLGFERCLAAPGCREGAQS